ncbi:TetR family transcriptional regulator [Antricoccus suffuscus]|uniref:TetR family transcriptional regulator n=1 Tax=Antricoccus suffuscus TaxID=1629062 RepID=A0A2T1A6W2_9ACTN|nr:TetR/AcrR family transcriptional regulator [Antricoccus suffuscus]PRZ44336.1 TetR family transcriptional regulator [Antricoccus suffuscus]
MSSSEAVKTTRPRNRKSQIVAAAADLFRVHGYHGVALADVADAVGISAPALYRHVRNKQELLLTTVQGGFNSLDGAARRSTDVDGLVTALVTLSMTRSGLAGLWQREARHLPDEEHAALRAQLTDLVKHMAGLLRAERNDLTDANAELVAWSLLGVLASLAARRVDLPSRRLEHVARQVAYAVVRCDVRADPAAKLVNRRSHRSDSESRREQLLNAAAELFDRRGFGSVSMNDIGSAVGIAGPSVYKHFAGKADLLAAVMVRGYERLHAGLPQVHAAPDPRTALTILMRSHIDFSVQNSYLIGLLISERDQLPDKERAASVRAQKDYLDVWVRIVDRALPGREPGELQLMVNAAFTVINNLVRTGRTNRRSDLADRLTELTLAIVATDL